MSGLVRVRGLRIIVFAAAVAAAALTVTPVAGEDIRLFKVVAPTCYDGDGQFMDAVDYGSHARIKAWLRRQQRGGPLDVKDGICNHWTNVWTVYVKDPGSTPEQTVWNWYKASEGCR